MAKGSHKKTVPPVTSQSDANARKILRGSVAVLPVGSIEQHGDHLPVSTDSDIATTVSARVCAVTGYAMLPPVSYGASFEHAPRLNMSIRGHVLRSLVADIAASLADAGSRGLVVINGHYGNQRHLARLGKKIRGHATARTIRCVVVPYWDFMSAKFDHAGHTETSLMLACGQADMRKAKRGFVEPDSITPSQHRALSRRASASFMSVASNGIWGDPRSATRAGGLLLLDEIADKIARMCRNELRTQRSKRPRRVQI